MRSNRLSGLARQAIGASLVVAMSASTVLLAGCGQQNGTASGGSATATADGDGKATDGKTTERLQKGDGGADVSDLGGADALGDLADYPEEYEGRVREDLAEVADKLSEDEVRYAATMLYHLEDKYGLDFKVVSVRPSLVNDEKDAWTAIFECQDESYAYGEDDDTKACYMRSQGDLRWVGCSASKSGDEVILWDNLVLQLRSKDIGESVRKATEEALAKHEGLEVQQTSFVNVLTEFKDGALDKADALTIDSKAEDMIPLVRFSTLGMVSVLLPDGQDAQVLAESAAGDIRQAYGDLGISDEDGDDGNWRLTLVLNGTESGSMVFEVTADGVNDTMNSVPPAPSE